MDADDQSPKYEIASVLFTDIVGYSLQPIDRQTQLLSLLQKIVRASPEFQQAHVKDALISLPTGDGMALVFLLDPVSPVKCALEIARLLERHPQIKLRMGLHTGPICRHADIKDEINVVGGGINMAQRVMDCGDAGHILLSRNVAEVLQQLSGWSDCLQDLSEHEVKHGVKVHLFNLCKDGLGNPALPRKCGARAPITLGVALESIFGSSQKGGQQTTAKPTPHIRKVTLAARIFALVAVAVGIPLITNSEFWYREFVPGGPSQARIHEFRIVSISRDVEPGSALGENRCSHRSFMARLLNKLARADSLHPRLVVIDKWYDQIPRGVCAPGQDGTPALSKAIQNISAKAPVLIAVGSYSRDEVKQQCPALEPGFLHSEEVILANYERFHIAEQAQQEADKKQQAVQCEGAPTGRVSFGLARIDADLRKIPLGWSVFCDCSGVKQRQTARPWPTIATAAATVLDPRIMKDYDLMIHPFTKLVPEGATNGFESVSAIKLICDQAGPEVEWTKCSDNEGDTAELAKLDGKVVVIGEIWNDVHRTNEGDIDGPTLQANYIAALLSEGLLRPAPEWVKYASSFAWLGLTFWIFYGWKPRSPELAMLVSALSIIVLAVLFNAVITRQWGIFADAVPPTILTLLAITGLYLARKMELLLESRR